MTKQLLTHLRHNTIAYFALFIALGGTSYASVKVPELASAHKSAKAGITCGGSCPAKTVYWAYVGIHGAPGGVIGDNVAGNPLPPRVYQTAVGGVAATTLHQGTGDWIVYFGGRDLSNCARFANLTHDRGSASVSGYDSANPDYTGIHVLTTNAAGQAADLDFSVVALCGGGNSGVTLPPAPPGAGVGGQP